MRIRKLSLVLPFASLVLCATAEAGVYLESVDKELDGSGTPTTSKMWFDGGRMRTERIDHDSGTDIVIFKNQSLYTLDSKSKSYRVIDKATAEKMGAQVAAAKKQMEARMAAMPPEQRKKMEEMMAKLGHGAGAMVPGAKERQRTLKNSGRTETVAGIKCTVWEAYEDGKKEEELCAAPAGNIPGGDDVIKTFREISTMLSSITEKLGTRAPGDAPWRDMETINGVPILTRDFDDGKATSETRMTVVRKESVAGASFEVPAGYAEKKMNFPGAAHSDDD